VKLARLQQAFWEAATDPANTRHLDHLFVGTEALSAAARLGVYARMYLARQLDVLRDDFPVLATVLGDEAFEALGNAYVRTHPSIHHSLARVGARLPAYVKSLDLARADLADLAALEWARAEVYEEADAEAATPADLRALLTDDGFADAVLRVVPALRTLRLDHDVLELWRQASEGEDVPGPRETGTFVVVWRKDLDVFHVGIEADEARALALAAAGAPFSFVCEAFDHRPNSVQAAFLGIGSWFAEGWIRAPERSPS